MSWDKSVYRGEIEPNGKNVYVYHSGRSGFHATIQLGYDVLAAYWSGSDVIVVLSNGQKSKYSNSSSWSSAY